MLEAADPNVAEQGGLGLAQAVQDQILQPADDPLLAN